MTAGDIYTVAGTGTRGFSGDGGPAGSAELNSPVAVALDGAGNLVISEQGVGSRIRVVAAGAGTFYGKAMTAGDIYSVAGNGNLGSGDGRPALMAQFGLNALSSIRADSAGDMIATVSTGRVWLVAGRTRTLYGRAMTAGDAYAVAGTGHAGFSGDGGPAAKARLNFPSGAARDGAGNLVIADSDNNRIRVVAASTGTFYGQAMTTGDIYTVAGTGKRGSSGDGGPAASAKVNIPAGVNVDGVGNVVFADLGGQRIRVIAASTGMFYGRAMTAGDIYTVAGTGVFGFSGDGGPATSARLRDPEGAAADQAGNLVIADSFNNRIRVVAASTGMFYGRAMTAGDIYTVAGTGPAGFSGDGGPAASAELNFPSAAAADQAGNLVIADEDNNRVRVVAGSTATFYGQTMTAGHIYTVAGTGLFGFSGDGGPATSAELGSPRDVAADGSGDLLIADLVNDRIRMVNG